MKRASATWPTLAKQKLQEFGLEELRNPDEPGYEVHDDEHLIRVTSRFHMSAVEYVVARLPTGFLYSRFEQQLDGLILNVVGWGSPRFIRNERVSPCSNQ